MNENPILMNAREQAEAWYARLLAPDCSTREREAFERWRAEPGNTQAYAATERLLADVDMLAATDPRMEALMQAARRRQAPRPGHLRRWGSLAVAAGLSIAVGLAVHLKSPPEARSFAYATEGEGTTVALEDGSRVQLDVASRVTVNLGSNARRVELLQGRALFEVAHDAARPFVVRAGDGSVTALGTRFQVQRDGDSVVVTLAQGAVAVARQDGRGHVQGEVRLQPGDQVRWSGGTTGLTVHAADTEAALGWTRGRLIFRGTPLADVAAEVNRYSPRKLVLADASLAGLPVYGNFIAGDAGPVVKALGAVLPVRAEEAGEEIRLHRR